MFDGVTESVSWRDAEASVFRVMERIEDGWVPRLDEVNAGDLRRIGYLVEVIGHYREPRHKRELLDFSNSAFCLTISVSLADHPLEAAVPGGQVSNRPQLDALARKWNFHPAIDLSRYEAETSRL